MYLSYMLYIYLRLYVGFFSNKWVFLRNSNFLVKRMWEKRTYLYWFFNFRWKKKATFSKHINKIWSVFDLECHMIPFAVLAKDSSLMNLRKSTGTCKRNWELTCLCEVWLACLFPVPQLMYIRSLHKAGFTSPAKP